MRLYTTSAFISNKISFKKNNLITKIKLYTTNEYMSIFEKKNLTTKMKLCTTSE